ncbi:plastocyanin/azurin family copper-binding protein [Chromohalobacter sp.]|uniref:cupredoxin domain-containing protein n=1 Tax=Chromohalobacter sp. TaxID=50740 RepID=UPI001DB84F53|nr:plastocyanin/azurin family copper-binding protein [Chromohalobacter sp.]NQY46420.1 cupredoxin domain-containing protein [Chromohalobacter sp.]
MYKKYLVSSLLAISLSTLAAASWASAGHGNSEKVSDADVDRTITVEAGDMWFDPEDIEASTGETIKFEITNTGSIEHEFTIGDESAQEEHRDMMQEMSEGDGGHHMSEGSDGMASVTIEPGETEELVWTVPDSVKNLEYACNIPGHYESGMYGNVTVK